MVIRAVGSTYGGTSQCVLDLARALGNAGVEVDLATTHANGAQPLEVPIDTWVEESSYRIRYFRYWGWSDYQLSNRFGGWLFDRIRDYDLVHTHAIFAPTNLPAYWACWGAKIPYVVTPHGMLEPWALAYKATKKRVYYHLLEKQALNRASAIHVLTSAEARGVERLNLKSPAVAIPNGIDRQPFEELPSPEMFYQAFPEIRDRPTIFFLGRIDPKKGLDLLAIALAKVRARFPEAHLVVAGPDNIGFLPTAREYFQKSGCSDGVTFTGMLAGTLKYAALAAADIYVAPSYSEGFSLSILEGMAAGLPCVITQNCNFPEARTAEAACVVETDASAIAEGLLECLANPHGAKQMGDRARQLIFDRYTWDRVARQMRAAYERIIDSPL